MITHKVAIITGASRGLGLEVAKHFARNNAKVVLAARESEEFYTAVQELKFNTQNREHIAGRNTDISKPGGVSNLIKYTMNLFGRIDILVCNAGIYGPIGPAETVDWLDWIETIETNLFGTVLCCRAVVPIMRKQGSGKIITLSGGGATQPLPGFSAYAASKAAVVRFTETLAKELIGTGIDVNSVAPGAMNTRLVDQAIEAGPQRAGDIYDLSIATKNKNETSYVYPVSLIEFLASNKSDGITGRLLSAVWDKWYDTDFLKKLDNDDIYTLRRINSDGTHTYSEVLNKT